MRTVRRQSANATQVSLILVLLAAVSGTTHAQTAAPSQQTDLEHLLVPGRTVWVTDASGREIRTRIVSVADGVVTTDSPNGARGILKLSEVRRVRARQADSVLNGALIGAGSAVATGLFVCSLTEPWANCRDDVGSILGIGALGAAAGAAVDALLRDRHTIFETSPDRARLEAAPVLARDKLGIRIGLTF